MKKLTIGFSAPSSKYAIFGRLIMLYTGTDYSHTYLKLENTNFPDLPLISQASRGMVNFTAEEVFLESNKVIKEFELEVTISQYKQIKRYAMKSAGKKYSIIQCLGIVIADIFGLNRNPLDMDTNTFVCSEYLGEILKLVQYQIPKHLSLVTPKDIYKALENK